MKPNNICVVHLVRKCNELEAFHNFVSAYTINVAGIKHHLLILFKGFQKHENINAYRKILNGIEYQELHVPDYGYDIGSYLIAFKKYCREYRFFCFLNSFSEPLCSGWLESMFRHISHREIGIVGATGSYQSLYTDSEYKNALYGRNISPLNSFLMRVWLIYIRTKRFPFFKPFPNPHIRSNGFMLQTSVINKLKSPKIRNKKRAYRFESGKSGLTNQILEMGLKALVIGADGKGYDILDWCRSNTFWRNGQENLLIEDNQTRAYRNGRLKKKAILSHHAWGNNASPKL